jgi:hypothetical protein
VAAPGPAPVAPQQVAPDGTHRQALGGVSVAFGVVEDLLVDPSAGSLHPGGEPVDAYRLAGACHFHQPLAQVGQGGDEGPVGLAVPERSQRTKQQVQAVADLGLGDPHHPARRYDSPSNTTAATASRRTSRQSGGLPPRPGRRGGSRWARRPASQARTLAGSDDRGQYDNGDRTSLAGVNTLPMVRSPHVGMHRASRHLGEIAFAWLPAPDGGGHDHPVQDRLTRR